VSKRAVYVEGLRAVLDALSPQTQRIIFTSSTGVYGQTDGSWVDEDSACRPTREGGRVMLEAEELLKRHRFGSRAIILRLAGLYGPDRVPRMADVRAGRPIPAQPGGSLNLIHVDDAVEVIRAVESRAQPPQTYVVSDGHPSQRRAFYGWLAELLQLPRPEFSQPSRDTGGKSWATSDKRVRNSRMLSGLGVTLRYPSYREGLKSIVDAQTSGNPATE
jgi:nucleoside-diphosphate-sugar epimerase